MNIIFASLLFLTLFVSTALFAQPPKLVVELVLDQFAYDYIARFTPYFGEDGFKYLMNNGANFTNCQYPYAYTKTACGHATIATGATPAVHGIAGNSWFDRTSGKRTDCVADNSVQTLGSSAQTSSPRNLMINTLGDLLKTKSPKSKIVGISNKNRSAILMAGKKGTAYWFDDSVVISSTYYMQDLPKWVKKFNRRGVFAKYFGKVWNELKPEIAKQICDDDDVPYETDIAGQGKAFPYTMTGKDSTRITPSYYKQLNHSPFATEILLDFARKVIEHESLGKRGVTDMLCVGISATDEVGHDFGPNSHEVFDNALRHDKMLAEFFAYLDKMIGMNNCIIVLSADHGIAPIPEYKHKTDPDLATARITSKAIGERADRILDNTFGKPSGKWIDAVIDAYLYVNESTAKEKGLSVDSVSAVLRDSLTDKFPFGKVYTSRDILGELEEGCFCIRVRKSFYPPRSGDVMLLLQPFSILDVNPVGTNHGMPYSYDAHVPLIFAGKGITKGEYYTEVSPLDIVPTLAKLLKLQEMPEWEGSVLNEGLQ